MKHFLFSIFVKILIVSSFFVAFSSCTKKNEMIAGGVNFSIELTFPWYETKQHSYIRQIKNAFSEVNIKGYTDGPNSSNFIFVAEIPEYQEDFLGYISNEYQGYSESIVNYNSNEFHVIMDHNNLLFVNKIAYIEYNDILFLFGFSLDNSKKDVADQILMSANFETIETAGKKQGFFSGIWHGVRAPFVFIINIFRKNDITLFSDNRTTGYLIGYILGALFILSGIFGGTSRRY